MVFRLCEVEIDSFPNQARVRGYVGVDFHFTATKGHKTVRKIEKWIWLIKDEFISLKWG